MRKKKTFQYGRYQGGIAVLWWIEVHVFKWLFKFWLTVYLGILLGLLFIAIFALNLVGKMVDRLIWAIAKLFDKEYEANIAEKILGYPYSLWYKVKKWWVDFTTDKPEQTYEPELYDSREVYIPDDRPYARGRAYAANHSNRIEEPDPHIQYVNYDYNLHRIIDATTEDIGVDEDERIDIDKMDGGTFEHFCADLLRVNGWTDVRVTPASGDYGIDITAEKDDIKWGFQCKRWGDTKVDAIAIGQTYKGKALYECDMVAVITTSTLTAQADGEAKQLGIKVWGRGKIRQLMSKLDNADDYYLSA